MSTSSVSLMRRPLPIAFALLTSLTVLAADSRLDAGKSRMVATFTQEGVPVEAPFRRFSGTVVYDPKNVSAARAALDVDTASLDIGDAAYNAEVRKKEWLDSAAFPQATFRSTVIKPGAAGAFTATGVLILKGRSQTLDVPVKVRAANGATEFHGTLAISRKAFQIGDPTWEGVLDDKVVLRFQLVVPAR